jgi:6,7-dimethyl-8-ribityllumazine synthase
MTTTIRPTGDHRTRKVAIVAARFTQEISEILLDDAVRTLLAHGVEDEAILIAWVPGCYELPLACEHFARRPDIDGVIALGCVIRGETSHYDYVCDNAARGIAEVGLRHLRPVIFGVLTTENRAQAMARSDGTKGRKGVECAEALLDMLGTVGAISAGGPAS